MAARNVQHIISGQLKRSYWGVAQRRGASNKTAGIIIIGDEVLRGDVRDVNSYFLLKSLKRYGVSVRRINFVVDSNDEIIETVKAFSSKFDYVVTCGGIGPTHDDITYSAIAEAFQQNVHLRRDMWRMFQKYFGQLDDSSPVTKIARIPEKAQTFIEEVDHNSRTFNVCLVNLGNVFILPGVPLLVEKIFPLIVKKLQLKEMPEISRELFLSLDEASVTDILNEAVDKFPNVTFGSYPNFYGNYFRTRLRLEAGRAQDLQDVEQFLRNSLPNNTILEEFVRHPLEGAHARVKQLMAKYDYVAEAYEVVLETLRRFKPENICVAFSGGKDCTVVAFLYNVALRELAATDNDRQIDSPQRWLYVRQSNARKEVDDFIEECDALYGAQMITVSGSYREAVQEAVDNGLNVFMLGNRMVDPKGETLKNFQETDEGWPRATRVFPILTWNYKQVWTFIRELYIPYCTLYDQGFSSLGEKSLPNPKLAYIDERGVTRFRAAFHLDDSTSERYGRA